MVSTFGLLSGEGSSSYKVTEHLQTTLREKMNLWIKWIFYGSLKHDKTLMKFERDKESVLRCKQKLSVLLIGKDNPYQNAINNLFTALNKTVS